MKCQRIVLQYIGEGKKHAKNGRHIKVKERGMTRMDHHTLTALTGNVTSPLDSLQVPHWSK